MNNKEGNKNNSGAKKTSRTSSNKPKPAMAKRAQGPKKEKPKAKDRKSVV